MKKIVTPILALLLFGVMACSPKVDQPKGETSKEQDIRMLMELTDSSKLGIQVMEQLMSSFEQGMPDVPAEVWKNVMKEFKADSLVDLMVPIYDKYFTHEEIKDIIAFYNTSIGKKLIAVLPKLVRESMQAGQQWGEEISRKVINDLKAKGYK